MGRILLSANWTNLLVANFETDKEFLESYLPVGTELNDWNGKYFMSLVGFEFSNTKICGIPSPFYRSFPELNLRFYVKRKVNDHWRKGVVFIKEIAPSKLIGTVAGWLYKENFRALPLKHKTEKMDNKMQVVYSIDNGGEANYISAIIDTDPVEYDPETLEKFILDHYWGYTKVNKFSTNEFRVIHRPWHIYSADSFAIKLNAASLYGKEFDPWINEPFNVFMMDGSATKVTGPIRL